MSDREWSESPYSRGARERSMDKMRERMAEAEREERERKCRCRKPLPGRVYLGVPLCALCQRLIYEPKEGV